MGGLQRVLLGPSSSQIQTTGAQEGAGKGWGGGRVGGILAPHHGLPYLCPMLESHGGREGDITSRGLSPGPRPEWELCGPQISL